MKHAVAVEKSPSSLSQASFERHLWQSDEPAPLVTNESDADLECPPTNEDRDCECEEFCLRCDIETALPRLWLDAKGVVNWNNAAILTAAGGIAIAMHQGGADHRVRQEVIEHPLRWGDGSKLLGKLGDVEYQAPILLGVYGYSVWSQDEELHDVMGTLLSATTITGISASTLKLLANTSRPSDHWMNGHYGFPSYHTASTFAIAAVLDEYYGSKVGLPAYALAACIGFSRLDEQDHDLSDVFFGGAMGFVIGKAVAGRHLCGNSKLQFRSYIHPTSGTPGIALEANF